MIRSLLDHVLTRRAALAAGALLAIGFLVPGPARADTVTLNGLRCTDFNPASQVLTCGIASSGSPSGCSIAGPAGGTVGQNITLTSQCSGGDPATSWLWYGGGCGGKTTQSCTVAETFAVNVTYYVVASNASGSTPPASQTTVAWSVGTVAAPNTCTLTASPSSLPAGGGSTGLAVNCLGGSAPTSYAWSASPAPSSGFSANAGSAQTPTITTTTTFTVTPSNSAGGGNQAQVTVTVAGGGSGGGLANCTAQGLSVLSGGTIPWGGDATFHSSDNGNFGNNVVWLFQITPTAPTVPHYSTFIISEYGGNAYMREMSLSPTPCDFRVTPDINGVTGPVSIVGGTTATLTDGSYDPSNPNTLPAVLGWPYLMAPNTTYYLSIRNFNAATGDPNVCPFATCQAVLTFNHQAF